MKKENIKTYESYIVNIELEEGIYGVTFYDFPGCVSVGDSTKEAIENAKEALQGHIDCMIYKGYELPTPTDLEDIIKENSSSVPHKIIYALIDVKIKSIKRKRIDITMSESVIEQIDEVSHNRSRFLEEASLFYINEHLKKS